jgi:hypothetical protein
MRPSPAGSAAEKKTRRIPTMSTQPSPFVTGLVSGLLLAAVSPALSAPPASGRAPFSVYSGWPFILDGSSVDGGMLVNMDDDDELELVQVTGNHVHAFDLDGAELPGWPKTMDRGTFSAPAFGDIDGDGECEIVAHSFFYGLEGKVWAFHRDGSVVGGFPLDLGGTLKAPALGDVDGDGDLEIISVVNISGMGNVYVLDGDGSTLPGWPQRFDDIVGTGPAVGDVDGDDVPEIFACSFYKVYGYRPDGSSLPGFPFEPGASQTFNYSTPVLADLDQDGDREILTATCSEFAYPGRAYVLEHDGTVAPGWPQPTNYPVFVPPSVADIDGDGWLDVALGDQVLSPENVNQVYAWDRSGNALPGFPVGPVAAIFAQIIIADIDGDGAMELMFDDNWSDSDIQALNHDGTPVDGWPLEVIGSSFQQSPSVADIDGDGYMDLAGSGNLVQEGQASLYLWRSALVWDPALAPLPTYQYNVQRDGVVPAGESSCPADFDGDGDVDTADLLFLLGCWGSDCGDVDGDGDTDTNDLLALLAAWGECP